MRLLGVVKSTSQLYSKVGVGANTGTWIIEEFTAQMRAVSKIALHRRSNLATFLEINGNVVILICPFFFFFFNLHLAHSFFLIVEVVHLPKASSIIHENNS